MELEKYSLDGRGAIAITFVHAFVHVIMRERTWHVKNKSLLSYLVSVGECYCKNTKLIRAIANMTKLVGVITKVAK